MGFVVGESVGPYQIVARVGGGGMATIYKAYQKTLDRFVALKVIHPTLKDDEAFLARLKREAEIIAKLNHPNIVAIYDFNEYDSIPYVVMQYIDGRTLKEIIQKQKLASAQILNIIRPIADALTYAHWRGVLHRDVKPSNVLIDNEGRVFLTDFGLARIVSDNDSTMSQDMLIGSPHYISPEQAKSEAVDERSDIYSLGIVLYEMFAGRVPFAGGTPYATVLAQINDVPPSPSSLNPRIRPAVEQVLLKALAKNPSDRYPSVSEMMRALENAANGPHDDVSIAAPLTLVEYQPMGMAESYIKPLSSRSSSKKTPWGAILGVLAVLGLIAMCAIGAWMIAPMFSSLTQTSQTAQVTATQAIVVVPTTTPGVVVIPPSVMPVTQVLPTFTTVPRATATLTPRPVVVADAPRGKIAYSIATGDSAELHSIWIANADGTDAHKIIDVAMWPALSPDGKQIVYNRLKDTGIYIANADGANARKLSALPEACCAQWSADGKRLVYFQGNLNFRAERFIYTVTADVIGTGMTNTGLEGFNPVWSPDGTKIVYANCQGQCGLFVTDLATKATVALTKDDGANPHWSPDSKRIVYQANDDNGYRQVIVVNTDGTGRKQLTNGKGNDGQPVFSADGNFIFWRSDQSGKNWGIFVMRVDGTNPRLVIPNAPPDANLWARESMSTSP